MSSEPAKFPLRSQEIERGVEDGYTWVAARAPLYGAVNGYVWVPDGHPWHDYEDMAGIPNNVPWGEITYGADGWLGFDTLHSGQCWPGSSHAWPDDQMMSEPQVIEWCKQLARDAAAAVSNGNYSI